MKVEHAGQHGRVGLVERSMGTRLHHEKAQLFGAMHVSTFRRRLDTDQLQQSVGRAVEHVDEWRHHPREEHQRSDHPATHGFRSGEGDRFGSQLAQYDVQEGDHEERHRDPGTGVDRAYRRLDAHHMEHAIHQHGDRRLADPAERQRGERDTELSARDVPVELTQGTLHHLCAAVPLGRHLVDAAPADCHQRKLGCNEEGVEQNQQKHHQQTSRSRTEGDFVDDGQRRVSKHTERKRTRG